MRKIQERQEPAQADSKTPVGKLSGKKAIMAILARAAEDDQFLTKLAYDPANAIDGYYTLNKEELAALVSGDIQKIEGWVGKLDKKHATWLWCRLQQEKWW